MSHCRSLISQVSSSLTCLCRSHSINASRNVVARRLSLSSARSSEDNKNYEINPEFINRNDRCLEYMNILPKRRGWRFQRPTRNFYYKVNINLTATKVEIFLEHSSGKRVVSASSTEWAIRQFLYSGRDFAAAVNTGRVFAERCQRAGIVSVFLDPVSQGGEKVKAILNTLEESGIKIGEEEVIEKQFEPGINYDRENRLGERKRSEDVQII